MRNAIMYMGLGAVLAVGIVLAALSVGGTGDTGHAAQVPVAQPAPDMQVESALRSEASHAELWRIVATLGEPAPLVDFIRNHPESPYRAEAMALLNEVLINAEVARSAVAPLSAPTMPEPSVAPGPVATAPVSFAARDLPDLLKRSPDYPPVATLPDAVWKDKQCRDCHKWTPSNLCQQAETFTRATLDPETENPHPLGLPFKLALRDWAKAGCP